MESYVERFLLSRASSGVAERTISWYRYQLMLYLDWLPPGAAWDDIETIEAFLAAEQQRGHKPNTVHARYRSLKAWFGWLHKREIIARSPVANLPAPRLTQEPVSYVRLVEYERLQGSIEGDDWIAQRDRLILHLLFWCGLRVSELVALRLEHIDLQAHLLTVQRGKGGKGRVIPCGADVGPLLLSYLMARPQAPAGVVFIGSDGAGGYRHELTVAGVAQMIERRCVHAHMRHLSPHKFRHGYAMAFLNAGMEMSAVSQTMGHSNQAVTADFYAKWLTSGLSRQYDETRSRLLNGLTR